MCGRTREFHQQQVEDLLLVNSHSMAIHLKPKVRNQLNLQLKLYPSKPIQNQTAPFLMERGQNGVRYNEEKTDFIKPGSVLLSHVLRHSIITAEDFRFPVRDGMERFIPRYDHQAKQNQFDFQTV